MVKNILVTAVVVAALFFGIGMAMPRDWDADKSWMVKAPAEKVFEVIATPSSWQHWMHWIAMGAVETPNTEWTYDPNGPDYGEGAHAGWDAGQYGRGRITVEKVVDGRQITYRVDTDGLEDAGRWTIELEVDGGYTRVHWHEQGSMNAQPWNRWKARLISVKRGEEMEKSLENLARFMEHR